MSDFFEKMVPGSSVDPTETADVLDGRLPVAVENAKTSFISTDNSSTTLLTNTSVFTGTWEDVGSYSDAIISIATDQNGTYSIQFSPDGTNLDSTLTRYFRTSQIEAPHRFTITRRYMRVVFTNDSGSDQTYFRLQTSIGTKTPLNAPCDSVLSQDFDALPTRPTDYNTEVALNRRQGHSLWNKFGYNNDIDTGTEVVASWGGTFTPLTTATTLNIVSTSTNDTSGGTGVNSIVVYGIDANRNEVTESFTMNGTTAVVSTSTWLGINRVAMFLCGSGQVNAGEINVTATTGGSTMAQMPAGGGVTQQCVFHVPQGYDFVMEWLWANAVKPSGFNPLVTVKVWVYSAISNGKQEVYKRSLDTAVITNLNENPRLPFPVTEQTVVWMEATTDKNDTILEGRFSGVLVRSVDTV
jgi:hypothetical protein